MGIEGTGEFRLKLEAFVQKWASASPGSLQGEGAIDFANNLYETILKKLPTGRAKAAEAIKEVLGKSMKEYRDEREELWQCLGFINFGEGEIYFRLREGLLRLPWSGSPFREYRRRRGPHLL